MTDKDKVVVAHYKSVGRKGKQLVEEEVKAGSDTAAFLAKMEKRRGSTPSRQIIDMRGKVPGEVMAYEFRGLVHYMDEKCIEIFENSLAVFDGKYTVGVNEDVMAADHTFKARDERERLERLAARQKLLNTKSVPKDPLFQKNSATGAPTTTAQTPTNQPNRSGAKQPEKNLSPSLTTDNPDAIQLIPFGYRTQRSENRLNASVSITVHFPNGQQMIAKTNDLSIHGLKLHLMLNCPPLEPDDDIDIVFSQFEQQYRRRFGKVAYRLIEQSIDSQQRPLLRLSRVDDSEQESFNLFLKKYIQAHQSRYKFELEDNILALSAKAYERIYTMAAPIQLCLLEHRNQHLHSIYAAERFTGSNDTKQALLGTVARHIGDFVSEKDVEQLNEQPYFLVESFLIKGDDKYHVFAAKREELLSQKTYDPFLKAASLSHYVARLQVSIQRVSSHDLSAVSDLLAPLNDSDPIRADTILSKWEKISHIAFISFVEEKMNAQSSLTLSNRLIEDLSTYRLVHPAIRVWHLGYRNERKESRYRYRSSAIIKIGPKTYRGTLVDFSPSGLRIQIDDEPYLPSEFESPEQVLIDLPDMQKLAKKTAKLSQLPYKITKRHPHQNTVSLKRDFSQKEHDGEKFFASLIRANKSKLPECSEDKESTFVAEMLESVVSLYLQGIPLFVQRFSGGRLAIASAAATENANRLLWRFKSGDSFNFSALNVDAFFVNTLKPKLNKRGALIDPFSSRLFVEFSESNSQALDPNTPNSNGATVSNTQSSEQPKVTPENMFGDSRDIARFILNTRKHTRFRILKVTCLPPPYFLMSELSDDIKIIRKNAPARVKEFENRLQQLVCIMDVEDITEFYRQ